MGGRLRRELFRMVVSDLVGDEPNLHAARLAQYVGLVRRSAVAHPEWTAQLLRWARHEAGLDYTARAGAAEFLSARLAAGQHGLSRQVIDSVLVDPLDPTWLLCYWNYFHGRTLPKPLKRGIGDAVRRLYTEEAVRQADLTWMDLRLGDVLNRVHPKPVDAAQSALFRRILDRRYDSSAVDATPVPGWKPTLPRPRLTGHTLLVTGLVAHQTVELVASRCDQAEIVRGADDLRKVVRGRFRRHDRVVVVAEGQELDRPLSWSVPRNVPLHVWDLAGREVQWAAVSRHRYRHDGTKEGALWALSLFEAGEQELWPW
ncbi:hypothetical protein SAMN04488564_12810 [Lentzea waywayandensis]|uniref:Uncharacterized protein n=1 Tax=Lentzea waywayandensis TaxID=84724 RepID=A0A1I6FJJ7_9PSEU|nr:hypothetical protein [Lentzea waywayandensis]SFR30095.1 hypothetical protein SAMN04488564_12810 [Lentzea waywayandensis]